MTNKVLLLTSILIITACSRSYEPVPPEVGASVVYSVETDLVTRHNGLAIGSNDEVYTTDVDGFSVRKYGPTGELIARVGSRGEGPGEFASGPRMLVYSGEKVVVAGDPASRMLHVFSDRLEYLDRYRLEEFHLHPTAHEGDIFFPVISKHDDGEFRFEIMWRHDDGTQEILFSVGQPVAGVQDERGMMFNTGFLATDGTVMAYAYSFRNAIDIYSMQSRESGPVTTQLPGNLPTVVWEQHPPSAPLLRAGPSAVAAAGVAVDQGLVFVLGGSLAEGHAQTVFVFDETGAPVGVVNLPKPAYDIDVRDGMLGFLAMDGSLVKLQLDTSAFPSP